MDEQNVKRTRRTPQQMAEDIDGKIQKLNQDLEAPRRWGDGVSATRPKTLENTGLLVGQAFSGGDGVKTTC